MEILEISVTFNLKRCLMLGNNSTIIPTNNCSVWIDDCYIIHAIFSQFSPKQAQKKLDCWIKYESAAHPFNYDVFSCFSPPNEWILWGSTKEVSQT